LIRGAASQAREQSCEGFLPDPLRENGVAVTNADHERSAGPGPHSAHSTRDGKRCRGISIHQGGPGVLLGGWDPQLAGKPPPRTRHAPNRWVAGTGNRRALGSFSDETSLARTDRPILGALGARKGGGRGRETETGKRRTRGAVSDHLFWAQKGRLGAGRAGSWSRPVPGRGQHQCRPLDLVASGDHQTLSTPSRSNARWRVGGPVVSDSQLPARGRGGPLAVPRQSRPARGAPTKPNGTSVKPVAQEPSRMRWSR